MSWAYSIDGIDGPYTGDHSTREAAIAAAVQDANTENLPDITQYGEISIYIAQARPPRVNFWGIDLLEHLAVWVEDDFGGPAAEDWPAFSATEQQLADLTRAIEAAFTAWLERHGMQPDWRVIEDPERLTLGQAREMATK